MAAYGSKLYVFYESYISNLTIFNTTTGKIINVLPFRFYSPTNPYISTILNVESMLVNPSHGELYIDSQGSTTYSVISIINMTTNKFIKNLTVNGAVTNAWLTPNGKFYYFYSARNNTNNPASGGWNISLFVVNTTSNKIVGPLAINRNYSVATIASIALSPDGGRAYYMLNKTPGSKMFNTANISVLNTSTGRVSMLRINTNNFELIGPLYYDYNNGYLYAPAGAIFAFRVLAIDPATGGVISTINP
jgi:DNA-binding beta-propeller fold protein YncE